MVELAEVVRTHRSALIDGYGGNLPERYRIILDKIVSCRTPAAGAEVYVCDKCKKEVRRYHSCQNRHCPKCGGEKTAAWLKSQLSHLLPVEYFLITFTIPDTLHGVAHMENAFVYNIIFRAAAETIKTFARDRKYIGGEPGFFGVLHTWKRDVGYHPHVHMVVAGGGIAEDGTWHPAKNNFFAWVKAMSKVYRGIFQKELSKNPWLFSRVDQKTWKKEWIVHSESVGDGKFVLAYLAKYVFRTAIGNDRIVKMDGEMVTYEYTESGTNHVKFRTVTAVQFLRIFLQHALPKGFPRIRYYGFLASGNRSILAKLTITLGTVEIRNKKTSVSVVQVEIIIADHLLHCPECNTVLRWDRTELSERVRSP
jgi:hypothetical protein